MNSQRTLNFKNLCFQRQYSKVQCFVFSQVLSYLLFIQQTLCASKIQDTVGKPELLTISLLRELTIQNEGNTGVLLICETQTGVVTDRRGVSSALGVQRRKRPPLFGGTAESLMEEVAPALSFEGGRAAQVKL